MFDTLSARLTEALRKITGRGVLRPEDIDAALREVRLALLEADVNFKVVKEFVERVRARLTGAEISAGLTAPQTVVRAVHDELVDLLGGNATGLRYASAPPTVVMLVGLQGSGKTTTAVKLALFARRDHHTPMVVGLDLRRPAAVEQLRVLAEREKVAFHSGTGAVEGIAAGALQEAARTGADVVILDTAGRLHADEELMDEVVRLKRSIAVTETLLVADGMTGQDAVKLGDSDRRSAWTASSSPSSTAIPAAARRCRCASRLDSPSVLPAPARGRPIWRSSRPTGWLRAFSVWATCCR